LDKLETLTQITLDDLSASAGLQARPLLDAMVRQFFRQPAQRFARRMLEFDEAVGSHGLVEAARGAQRYYVRATRVFDSDRIPSGAFLALSNHPGMADTLALFTALNRPDLKVIAQLRPFLRALPNTEKHLIYLSDAAASNLPLVRRVSDHLRAGGAALTFPAGRIEPDPDVHEGARESLQSWTDSVGVFIRLAPEAAILPVLVRGVVWDKAAHHPLTRIRATRYDRERLAAALQLLASMLWNVRPVTVRVQIGMPIRFGQAGSRETSVVHRAVLAEMQRLIENPPVGSSESAI